MKWMTSDPFEALKYFACFLFFGSEKRSEIYERPPRGTKKLLCCWNGELMVTTSQLVKSQSSVYLTFRSSKAKKKRLWFSKLLSPLCGRFWIFLQGVSWPSHSSDACHCVGAHGVPTKSPFMYFLAGGFSCGLRAIPLSSHLWGRCPAAPWHLLACWESARLPWPQDT